MSSTRQVLIVTDDGILSEMLESAVELGDSHFRVTVESCPEEALQRMQMQEFHAVVADLDFQDSDFGPEFAAYLAGENPPIPHFVLSTRAPHELPTRVRQRSVIFKPIDMDTFLERLNDEISEVSGQFVSGVSMDVVLQIFHQEGKTGQFRVQCSEGLGRLAMRQGQIVFARLGELEGREALFKLLGASKVSLHVTSNETQRVVANLHESFDNLLLQWSVKRDECAA